MRRITEIIACSLFLISTAMLGQEIPPAQPSPEDALTSRELVAWSYLQTPQPTPQPAPAHEDPLPRPDQQRVSQPEVELFVGQLRTNSGRFTLQVAGCVYPLDGNIDARDADQTVRVIGNRDKNGGAIHALKIERLP
jgi:hypothetical protein